MSKKQTGQDRYENLRRWSTRFHELHSKGHERFGLDWLRANTEATAAAHYLGVDPSTTENKALLSETCFRVLASFEPLEQLRPPAPARPVIVCLCGSGRFRQTFDDAECSETLAGRIVLTIGCNTKDIARDGDWAHFKPALDELHKRKIDLADEVFALNVGGYVGESTRSEINYAQAQGKRIRFLEPVDPEHFFMEGKGD